MSSSTLSDYQYKPANAQTELKSHVWQPGFWKRIPLLALSALLGAILCATAAAAVLVISDGNPIDEWRLRGATIQPTVLLAIFTALANIFLRFAFGQGITVFWWCKALEGSTIHDLHKYWDHGQNLLAVVTSGRYFDLVALSSLLVTISVVDGPLLQRASTVATILQHQPTNLSLPISPGPFIIGATGLFQPHEPYWYPTGYNLVFLTVVQQYNNRSDIKLYNTGCRGTCQTEVLAAGWDVQCEDGPPIPYQLQTVLNETETETPEGGLMEYQTETFHVDVNYNQGLNGELMNIPEMFVSIGAIFKATPGINGTLTQRNCTLREAVVRYPISITNDTVTLLPSSSENLTEYLVARPGEDGGLGIWPSTVGGLWLALHNQFASNAFMYLDAAYYAINTSDSAARDYLTTSSVPGTTAYMWNDPVPDMLNMMRELKFRAAVATTTHGDGFLLQNDTAPAATAAYGDSVPALSTTNRTLSQTVATIQTYPETVYRSEFGFLAGGLAVMFLGVFGVLPIFLGWWKLGRKFTMSPIETAKAFNAPVLQIANSNSSVQELITATGEVDVKYGVSDSAFHHGPELAATDRAKLEPSVENAYLGLEPGRGNVGLRKRLGIANLEDLRGPRRGELFF